MGAQRRLDNELGGQADRGIRPVAVADPRLAGNVVHLMHQDVLARLNSDKDARRRHRVPLHAMVTIPVTIVAATCLVPVAVATFGIARVVRGRLRGLGTDSAVAARAVWHVTDAAVRTLMDQPDSGRR
jgi:hypothetical protein